MEINNTLLNADDRVLLLDSDEDLQKQLYSLHNITNSLECKYLH
jgi:hypothetical protein